MDILNQLESYNGLKLKDVVFNKGIRKLSATFLYNPTLFVVADKVEEIESLLKSIVPENVVVETRFIRTSLDKANIALFILNTITNNFPSIAKNFSLDDIKLNIDNSSVQVNLYIDPTVYDFVENYGKERDIEDKLKAAAKYVLGNWLANKRGYIKESKYKILTILAIPLAYIVYIKRYNKRRNNIER